MSGLLAYNEYMDRIEKSPLDEGGGGDNQRGYEGGEVGENTGGRAGQVASGLRTAAAYGGYNLGVGGTLLGAGAEISDGKNPAKVAGKTAFGLTMDALGPYGQIGKFGYGMATSENPAKTATTTTTSLLGGLFGGPLGSMIGGVIGSAAYNSYEDGMIGDAMDSRTDEGMRDRAENAGYSRGQTADAADVSARDKAAPGIDPGLHSSGYGISPGISDIDTALGRIGRSAFDGYDDSGYGGSDSNGGRDNGNDTGHDGSGARGDGDEGNSSPGGIGGY